MSKIAQYLNEHLLGTVSGLTTLRAEYATDGSVLTLAPELVVAPKNTNDIRKAARFSWQLAEKGHVLSLTPRGFGSDTQGAALGGGLMVDTSKHLDQILYISSAKDKRRITHVQPGVGLRSLNEALKWSGAKIGAYSSDMPDMTVGGAIASGVVSYRSGKYGDLADSVDRMEVVLANGDLIELGRLSKREVSRKQGEQTLEGEIYRQIDGLLEENAELIAGIDSDGDNLGYKISQVKAKDGSIDLTPLFFGSQGTLGVISEVVLKTDFYSDSLGQAVIACRSMDEARDVADYASSLEPAGLTIIDGEVFRVASERGKNFVFAADIKPEAVVYVDFDDIGTKAIGKKMKKLMRFAQKSELKVYTDEEYRVEDLDAVRDVMVLAAAPQRADETSFVICDGAYVPAERTNEFYDALKALADKNHVKLLISANPELDTVSARTILHLKKVSDKQKAFKLLSEVGALVARLGGSLAGAQAEGRLAAFASYPALDKDVATLNEKIRKIFDPFGTLNPGVKQATELRSLSKLLKS